MGRNDVSKNTLLFHDLKFLFILIFKEHDKNKHKPNGVPRLQVKYYISRKNSLSDKPEDSLGITSSNLIPNTRQSVGISDIFSLQCSQTSL